MKGEMCKVTKGALALKSIYIMCLLIYMLINMILYN